MSSAERSPKYMHIGGYPDGPPIAFVPEGHQVRPEGGKADEGGDYFTADARKLWHETEEKHLGLGPKLEWARAGSHEVLQQHSNQP